MATFSAELPRCVAGARTLCLSGGRFEVAAAFETTLGESGYASAVTLTDDTGYFWFFDEDNVEMLVKVLDVCGPVLNNRIWVFAGGLTSVEVRIRVRDTYTGLVRMYENPQGVPFQPILDTSAFGTCTGDAAQAAMAEAPASRPRDVLAAVRPADVVSTERGDERTSNAVAPGVRSARRDRSANPATGACTPTDTVLCLNGGRFRVEASWTRPSGETGQGRAQALTDDTGDFWFFDQANIELVIKVLDACGPVLNDRFWVFAGGLTDVRVDLTVTDTVSGETMSYVNAQGVPFQPIQDTDAFATCP